MKRIVYLVFFLVPILGCAQIEWKKVAYEKGVTVYTAPYEGSGIKQVKVTKFIPQPPEKILHKLLDCEKWHEWAYSYKEAHVIKRISADDIVIYGVFGMPWPLADREITFDMKVTHKANGDIIIEETNLPEYVLKNSDYVRIEQYTKTWHLIKKDNGTLIVAFGHVDPSGSLPPLVINMFISDSPIVSLSNLEQLFSIN